MAIARLLTMLLSPECACTSIEAEGVKQQMHRAIPFSIFCAIARVGHG
jgi:hypothetical protein